MADSDQTSPSSSSPPIHRDSELPPPHSSSPSPSPSPSPPPSSSSSSPVREEEDGQGREVDREENEQQHQDGHSEMEQQHVGSVLFRGLLFGFDDASVFREDTCSCFVVVITFWIFVSMTMIFGVYGAVSLSLGPNCSFLIQPNPLFAQSLKVEELYDNNPGLMLYGFYKSPPLDVVKTWNETQNITIPADSHSESRYYLNKGSQINISYCVNSPVSSLFLVIAQGGDSFSQWLEDPTYPNTTLSWNVIRGSGVVQQNISQSSSYYVAVGNMNSEEVEVQLHLRVRALIYNTTEAYYKCTFIDGICTLKILFQSGNTALLTSPATEMGLHIDDWDVRLSYGPRWTTYIVGIAVLSVLMLAVFNFLNKFRSIRGEEGSGVHFREVEHQRAPLLAHKDEDLSSWGSSYDSASNDERDFEDFLAAGSIESKSSRDGENGNNTKRLCAICFDAPRDCFFLPCGHCVACFACGERIAEAAGTCPICRRNIRKVRRIFTV